jgi:hypothetical protein
MSRKVGEHTGVYYGKPQKGVEVEGNLEKELEAYKKYLATTIGRGLDIRSLIKKEESAVQ